MVHNQFDDLASNMCLTLDPGGAGAVGTSAEENRGDAGRDARVGRALRTVFFFIVCLFRNKPGAIWAPDQTSPGGGNPNPGYILPSADLEAKFMKQAGKTWKIMKRQGNYIITGVPWLIAQASNLGGGGGGKPPPPR
jgi:hypothetical protein